VEEIQGNPQQNPDDKLSFDWFDKKVGKEELISI